MASRAGFPVGSGSPMNPGVNPVNPGHAGGMRMAVMQPSSGYRGMPNSAPPYHQVKKITLVLSHCLSTKHLYVFHVCSNTLTIAQDLLASWYVSAS